MEQYSVTDSAGVRIVESFYPRERCSLSETAVRTVPSREGGDDPPWGRIDDVVVSRTGEVVVLDGLTSTIWFFDSAGGEAATFRAPGRGPMEFERFGGVFKIEGGVAVFDPALRRVGRFSLQGAPIDQNEVQDAESAPWPSQYYFRASSRGAGTLLSPELAPTGVHADGWAETPYRILDESADGFLIRKLPVGRRTQVSETGAGMGPLGFGAFTSAAWQDGRLLRTAGNRFEVGVFRPDGSLEATWRRVWEGTAVSNADRVEWVRHFVQLAGFVGPEDPAAGALREMLEASVAQAREMPATSSVLAAPGGAVWVRSYQAPWDSREARWSVFGAEGQWVMEVEGLPAATRLWRIGEEGVWLSVADALGLERLELRTTICRAAEP